jgi:membrane protein DedA with SNARE-associated domain
MTPAGAAVSLGVATLLSEDLAAIGGAVLAADGSVDVWLAFLSVTVGIYLGDLLLFALGRSSARFTPLRHWIERRWSAGELDALATTLDQQMALTVLTSRFIPGSRLPMYVAAGVLSRNPASFCIWTLVAVGVWTPLLMGGVLLLGEAFEATARSYIRWAPVVGLMVGLQYVMRLVMARRRQ